MGGALCCCCPERDELDEPILPNKGAESGYYQAEGIKMSPLDHQIVVSLKLFKTIFSNRKFKDFIRVKS